MKRYLPIGFVVLGLAGCSKATPEPAPKPTPYTVSWTAEAGEITTQSYLTGTGSGRPAVTVRVGGRVYSSGTITTDIQMEVPPAVGTYTFGPSSPAWATYQAGSPKYYAGVAPGIAAAVGSGSITVTEFTGHSISGTFSFTAVDPNSGATKTISNGKFYVPE